MCCGGGNIPAACGSSTSVRGTEKTPRKYPECMCECVCACVCKPYAVGPCLRVKGATNTMCYVLAHALPCKRRSGECEGRKGLKVFRLSGKLYNRQSGFMSIQADFLFWI